uniref:Methyltransferase type 11 domain-containing protein n=1 Tax=Noctiluca scintillans TaxID=2966 RepID=A0A7S1B136_NOCSC
MAQYGKTEYWEERYTRDPEPFDWYQRWAGLKDTFAEYVQPHQNILMLGAGNSRLSEEMYEENYHNITNIDISPVCVKAMQEKYRDKSGMSYQQMDARAMDLPDGRFDVVIDKATLDSVLCGEGSTHNAQKMLTEVSRVLNGKGVYLAVSHGQPSYRMTYLQRPEFGWTVKIFTVQKPMMGMTASLSSDDKDNVHYIYVCVKGNEGTKPEGQ